MAKVDWSYHRAGCNTCGKTAAFLAEHEVKIVEQVNARKSVLAGPEALELAAAANDLYATKGKKVIHINLKKEQPDSETLLKLMLGPKGNLRAPTLRKGKTLIVGFDEETYQSLFGA